MLGRCPSGEVPLDLDLRFVDFVFGLVFGPVFGFAAGFFFGLVIGFRVGERRLF